MFEKSLVESSSLLRGRSRWPAMAAIAIQAALVVAVLALPLLHPDILPLGLPRLALIAAPPVPKSPPPPPPPAQVIPAHTSNVAAIAAPLPSRVSRVPFLSDAQGLDRPALAVGVNLAGTNQPPLAAIGLAPPMSPHVNASAPSLPKRLQVSTGVMQGRLLEPIQPQYPAIARLSRSEGTVVVRAIISTTGRIESAQVVSGPAILQGAALDAVRRARYRPFLLNDQPTAVETTISIVFRLGS